MRSRDQFAEAPFPNSLLIVKWALKKTIGLEIEKEEVPGEIKRPFDPEKIKVRTVNVVVDQIVSRIDHQEIDLAPDFQRMAGIWNSKRKSRLIESLLLRIPIPVFYVAANENETLVRSRWPPANINDLWLREGQLSLGAA